MPDFSVAGISQTASLIWLTCIPVLSSMLYPNDVHDSSRLAECSYTSTTTLAFQTDPSCPTLYKCFVIPFTSLRSSCNWLFTGAPSSLPDTVHFPCCNVNVRGASLNT